ncbi:MAG: tryptophan synthase subunit alpha, partial [Halobacteriales archaeon]
RLDGYDIPKAVGFGIKTGEHARDIIRAGADGIIVGSALVDIVAEGEDVEDRLEAKARELKEGVLAGAETATDTT